MGNFKIKDRRPESLPKGPLRDVLIEEKVRKDIIGDGIGKVRDSFEVFPVLPSELNIKGIGLGVDLGKTGGSLVDTLKKGVIRREDVLPQRWSWWQIWETIKKAGIVILGGGPAGTSTAIEAALTLISQGLDPSLVVLVEKRGPEKQTYGNEKVCGAFVMKDGLRFMRDELGVDPALIPHTPIKEIHLADGGFLEDPRNDRPTSVIEEPEWGSIFHRKDLDHALIMRAQELGVTVLFGGSARSVTQDENGMFNVEVHGPRGTEPLTIATRLLVGAFGVNPNLKEQFFRLMGASLSAEDDFTGIAYRYIGNGMPEGFTKDALRLSLLQVRTEGGMASTYAWDWPAPEENGETRSNKGFGFLKLEHGRGMKDFDKLAVTQQLFPADAGALVATADNGLFKVRGAHLPMYRPGAIPEVVIKEGRVIAVVGDAAGHINPLSGEGITEAMEDGMLGVVLAKALISGDLGAVRRYALRNNFSPVALNRRLSYGIATELFHDPKHYRNLVDAILRYPEAGKLLTTFIKREFLGLKQLDRPTLNSLVMVARTDPSISVALLKVFREASRYAGKLVRPPAESPPF